MPLDIELVTIILTMEKRTVAVLVNALTQGTFGVHVVGASLSFSSRVSLVRTNFFLATGTLHMQDARQSKTSFSSKVYEI